MSNIRSFPPFCGMPGLVSIGCSVQAGWLPRVPFPPGEHDAFRCLPMNTTTMFFLRSDPAMYTSPGRTYARVGVQDPARVYTYVAVFSFLHPGRCTYMYMLRARLYIDQYVRTRSRLEWQRYARFDQVGPDCQALPCVRRCRWWVPAIKG